MAAKNQQNFIFQATMDQFVALLRDPMFCSTLNLQLKSENPFEAGVWYRFHHGTTFTSWGEKITITLTAMGPGQVNVDILSECGMPTQVVDWGKNKQNVGAIIAYISDNLARYVGVQPMPQPTAQPVAQPAPQPSAGGTKFCRQCGQQLPVTAAFCTVCGSAQS